MPQGTPLSDDDLRLIARAGIAEGRLPLLMSHSAQASYGSGIRCSLCERPIAQRHIEYEVPDPRDGRPLSFHLACHGTGNSSVGAGYAAGRTTYRPCNVLSVCRSHQNELSNQHS